MVMEDFPPLSPAIAPTIAPAISWAHVVQKKKSLTKYELQVTVQDGVGSVIVPDEVFEDPSPLWEDFLIGKFLDTAPHVAKVHAIVNKIWAMGDKSQMIDVHALNSTTMRFRIVNPITQNRILRRGMWNLAEVPVIMSKWTPFAEENSPEISSVPLWVHLKNVPIDMFSWKGLSFATSAVGEPVRLHPDTARCLDFKIAKVFVKADLSKELPKSMNFNHKGKDTLIEFSYSWLPPRCSICQKWGHLHKVCVANRSEDSSDKEQSTQQNTATSPIKRQETPMAIMESDKATISVGDELVSGENNNCDTEAEWSIVSPGKGGRSPNGLPKTLEYGEVSILSKSSFSVLMEMEEDSILPKENNDAKTEVIPQESGPESQHEEEETETETVATHQSCDEDMIMESVLPLRQNLPRASKANHRVISDQSVQKNMDKRVTRRNI